MKRAARYESLLVLSSHCQRADFTVKPRGRGSLFGFWGRGDGDIVGEFGDLSFKHDHPCSEQYLQQGVNRHALPTIERNPRP